MLSGAKHDTAFVIQRGANGDEVDRVSLNVIIWNVFIKKRIINER